MSYNYPLRAIALATSIIATPYCYAGSSQTDALQEQTIERVYRINAPHPDVQIRAQVQSTRRDIAEALKRSFAGDLFTAETTDTGDFTVKPSFVPKDWNLYYKGNTLKLEYRISF